MSTLRDAIDGIKKVLLLTEKVNSTATTLEQVVTELREHDRRIVRIESMIELSLKRPLPPSA